MTSAPVSEATVLHLCRFYDKRTCQFDIFVKKVNELFRIFIYVVVYKINHFVTDL